MKTLINPRNGLLALMILSAGTWRLFVSSGHSPLANFTPVGAMALFGGCYFNNRWKAFTLPLLTLWLSDLLLGYFVYYHEWKWFYNGFLWTYGSFALIVFIGNYIKKVNAKNVLWAGVTAAFAHWIITDLGVWMQGSMYPQNAAGFIACYAAALPFLKNMLIGNVLFGAILFGTFEYAQFKFPHLQKAQ